MGRKRKRVKAPAAASPEAESRQAPAAATSAGAANPTSPTVSQQVALGIEDTAAKHGAQAGDAAEELREDHEDSSGSDGLPGIPWALPPEESDQTDDEDGQDEEEEEQEEEEGEEEEEDGEGSESSEVADGGGPSSLSATMLDPENRWKQHPDRRRNLGGGGGGGGAGGGRPNSSSTGTGRSRAKSARWPNRKPPEGGGRAGARGRRGEGNAGAETGWAEGAEDGAPAGTDGYYGPRARAPPCTVFAPREGKIHRVNSGGPSATGAPIALVVGLEPLERLCFLGAALVRCGRGRADLSGYTLLPSAWGAYVEAHSPRWMGLLVLRALDAEEYSDAVALGGGGGGSAGNGADAAGGDAAEENEIEEAIDRIAEDFPVVVVLKSLSRDKPLSFLSAQADADALYSQAVGAGDRAAPVDHQELLQMPDGGVGTGEQDEDDAPTTAGSGREGPSSFPLGLAAELQLPGMQVVVTEEAGLRPFTVSQGWADATDAVLAAPPPTAVAAAAAGGGTVLVCGAKGVGKSSLCRFLVNRMLGRHREVAYMDCDLGQPEFTAPGQVSLHVLQTPVVGPPHANIRRPRLAYFVGTTASKPEPLLYSAAIRALAERAGAEATLPQQQEPLSASFFAAGAPPPPPLVVNTDGWVKGMGEDLLGAVIDAVRPRHIVQILGNLPSKTFELDLNRLPAGCEVHRVEAWSPPPALLGGPSNPPPPSAQDQRVLRLVAYFLGRGGSGGGGTAAGEASDGGGKGSDGGHAGGGDQMRGASVRAGKVHDLDHEVAALLAAARPRRVPWRAVQIRVMNGSVSPSLVLHAINGALVGLVAMPRPACDGVRSSRVVGAESGGGAEPPVGGGLVCLAETPLAPCVGLGIVRSVDVERRLLYVLTPEPADVLRDVNVLVMGSLQLPMVMLYDPNWCSHPYLSSEAVGGGALKNRALLRRGQDR